MKIKTSELIGPALNWAVAKAGPEHIAPYYERAARGDTSAVWSPSTDPSQAWLIIEREGIATWRYDTEQLKRGETRPLPREQWEWRAALPALEVLYVPGPTPLIAAMRCYVASKLGDEIDVPEELLK